MLKHPHQVRFFMKNSLLLFCFISTLSLVACNQGNSPTKVEYSMFYQKIQEIEENHHSHATMNITYFDDLSGKGVTIKATLNYSWNDEQNKYIPDEEYEYDLTDEINRTVTSSPTYRRWGLPTQEI